jgi:hypothetical protein
MSGLRLLVRRLPAAVRLPTLTLPSCCQLV